MRYTETMFNPHACEVPSDLCGPFDGDDDKGPDDSDLPDRTVHDWLPPSYGGPSALVLALRKVDALAMFPDVEAGIAAGYDFRRAEEVYDLSPCGIHVLREPARTCHVCERLAASLPAFLDTRAAGRPTWFAQD